MICTDCKEKGYFQALSEGTCLRCGERTPTPHASPYKICKKCSMKHGLCKQCGKKVN